MNNLSKKISSIIAVFVLAITMLFSNIVFVSATARTQGEAVAWANQRYYERWRSDYDGVYGCQCVDLIKCYCDYLGDAHGSFTRGNARDYATNSLPAGWTRNSNPRAGDVMVSTAGTYGHVGIVTEVEKFCTKA